MAKSRKAQPLGPLADKALVLIGDLAAGAGGLSARDEKRLNELVRKAKSDRGLTAGERAQVLRLAYKAVPAERIDDLKRIFAQRGGTKTRPRLRK